MFDCRISCSTRMVAVDLLGWNKSGSKDTPAGRVNFCPLLYVAVIVFTLFFTVALNQCVQHSVISDTHCQILNFPSNSTLIGDPEQQVMVY